MVASMTSSALFHAPSVKNALHSAPFSFATRKHRQSKKGSVQLSRIYICRLMPPSAAGERQRVLG